MLYIFVEGETDEKFFSKIFFCEIEKKFIQYSNEKKDKINNFIKSIKSMPNSDYLFFSDGDGRSIEDKSDSLTSKYNQIERNKLFIVQYEIESWYYAGVKQEDCLKLKLKHYEHNTEEITKEQLYSKITPKFNVWCMLANMLEVFSIDVAKERNTSIKYFVNNYKEPVAAVS